MRYSDLLYNLFKDINSLNLIPLHSHIRINPLSFLFISGICEIGLWIRSRIQDWLISLFEMPRNFSNLMETSELDSIMNLELEIECRSLRYDKLYSVTDYILKYT